ncbi:MAG: RNA polymerase sigma factor [Nannocystales bacterium]
MDSDLQLFFAWREGDRDAGDRLLRKHVASLRRFFHNKVDREVDDLVQRTFLACTKAKNTFEGRASFRTLLFVLARRQLIRFYERAARHNGEDIESLSVEDLRTSPSQLVARAKEHTLLLAALRRIPLELQMTVELHYWEDLTTSELSQIMEIPQGTVKSRLRRAREALARELGTFEDDGAPSQRATDDLESWARALRETAAQPAK